MYCVVKDNKVYEGSKEDIISRLCKTFYFDSTGKLHYEISNYGIRTQTWTDEYTYEEKVKDAIQIIWNKLESYHYRIYVSPTWNHK